MKHPPNQWRCIQETDGANLEPPRSGEIQPTVYPVTGELGSRLRDRRRESDPRGLHRPRDLVQHARTIRIQSFDLRQLRGE